MTSIEIGLLILCFFLVGVQSYFVFVSVLNYEKRTDNLLKLIRSLENKLSAKDLGGYIALQQHDKVTESPRVPVNHNVRSDDYESMLEEVRLHNLE